MDIKQIDPEFSLLWHKLSYFGHLLQRPSSLEKEALLPGKTEVLRAPANSTRRPRAGDAMAELARPTRHVFPFAVDWQTLEDFPKRPRTGVDRCFCVTRRACRSSTGNVLFPLPLWHCEPTREAPAASPGPCCIAAELNSPHSLKIIPERFKQSEWKFVCLLTSNLPVTYCMVSGNMK